MHSVYPYSKLRSANVLGTEEVLRLACRHLPTPAAVFHVSTLSVFPGKPGVVLEEDPLTVDYLLHLGEGYAQTKLVADRLVLAARARGVPVAIFRPGRCNSPFVSEWHVCLYMQIQFYNRDICLELLETV